MTSPTKPALGSEAAPSDRVWTVPNGLSVLRLLGVPLFLWLALGPEADGWAVIVLMVGGFTDYADGKIARRYNLTSKLGALLDPAADRLYILATLFALCDRRIVPVWLAALIVGRDVVLSVGLLVLRRHGYPPPEVHFLGKAATLNLFTPFRSCCSQSTATPWRTWCARWPGRSRSGGRVVPVGRLVVPRGGAPSHCWRPSAWGCRVAAAQRGWLGSRRPLP